MKKQILFTLGVLCALAACRSQSPPLHALTIGDKVPDITFNHILNYKDTKAKLSDFKGKPLILDFFATWCGACIGALPKLDSLQQAFGDSLQTLVIDYEPADKVKKFLEKNKVGQSVSLPFVTGDSLLSYVVFPHRAIPHEIWIDAEGVIRAITLPGYVTARNLRGLINKEPLDLPLKQDMMHFDNDKPLFVDGNGGDAGEILYKSTLSKYIDGLGGGLGIYKDSTTIRLCDINSSVLDLFSIAMHGIGNRFILEVQDKSCYINNGSLTPDQWARKHDYSYELIAPAGTPDSVLRHWMLRDLNRWLGLDARWERRMVSCWALVMKNKKNFRCKTKGGKPKLWYGSGIKDNVFRNVPISKVVDAMNEQSLGKSLGQVILDETGYTGNVDLELKVPDLHNIPGLRKALRHYGLDIVPVKRTLKMFVITEKDFNTSSGPTVLGMN